MRNPYAGLPPERFWRSGVAEQHPLSVSDLYKRKFSITPHMRIATGGSCFAQHIGGHLRSAGYQVMDVEPAPALMGDEAARKFGYRIYSARYGNIYLAEQLWQIAQEAYGLFTPADAVWRKGDRFYDAMRPSVEPQGLASPAEVLAHRQQHLRAVRQMFESMDLFIFTFGLTEGWIHKASGTTYPTAPGALAGAFDPEVHAFKNFRHAEVMEAFLNFRALIRQHNPGVRFLVTVSPVPLTATASEEHVLAATTYSKSVLRAVAGELASDHGDIDYFPSYELIASPFSKGFFYSSNLRNVEPQGVLSVMRVFFSEHPVHAPEPKARSRPRPPRKEDIVCEEAMLEAFGR